MSPRRARIRHSPIDVVGRDIRVGDWVRVVSVPESIARMHRDAKRAFARAVGKTFQIEAFDELGCAELDLTGKVGWDTIWIEPSCVQRFRRPRRQSRRFRRVLETRRKLDRPRWSLSYVAKYHPADHPDRLIKSLLRFEMGQGCCVLPERNEIHGTFYAKDKRLSSKRRLERLKGELEESELFRTLHLGTVRLRR